MNRRAKQSLLPFQTDPHAEEIATGEACAFSSADTWPRDTMRLGQVATPEPIARLMAKWVMSARPGTVLDPAVGLGGLLRVCHELDNRPVLIGVERDEATLRRAIVTAPSGTKLILADYLKFEHSPVDGIVANPPYTSHGLK